MHGERESEIIGKLKMLSPLDPGCDEKLTLQKYDLAFRTFSFRKLRECKIPNSREERDYTRAGLCDKAVQYAVEEDLVKLKAQVRSWSEVTAAYRRPQIT